MYYAEEDVVEVTMHVGSRKFPMCPIRSQAEFAYHLSKALDLSASLEGTSLTPSSYRTDRFIIGIDCETAGTGPSGYAKYTGLNTSTGGGSTIRVEMRNLNARAADPVSTPPASTQVIDRIYMTIVYNAVLEVSDSGARILE
jgi:hypothetical protein